MSKFLVQNMLSNKCKKFLDSLVKKLIENIYRKRKCILELVDFFPL